MSALTATRPWIVILIVAAGAAHSAESDKWPLVLPAPHGSVILPNENAKRAHDEFRYAAVRRVDNMLYISGVIVGRREGEGKDAAAFKLQVDRGFQRLKSTLEAAGATFNDVVMINSFHVWQGPDFEGTKSEQFALFEEIAGNYLKPPYPAWTAVGTTGLLGSGGIVEVQLIARLPGG
jgi:enamine deaminase RidA (YjgF/YER057c/UK114 family)